MATEGGTSLGAARGKVIIDLTDLNNVVVTTQQVGQQAERNLERIGRGAKKAQGDLDSLAAGFRSVAGALGIGLGIGTVTQLARFVVEVDALATAYARQSVAALSLAGSQEKLNELLAAYDRATGGAIDKATALGDVTRLQAIGFADSAEELQEFATAARGISVATGQQQDYVISQLQLAIANQSTLRLDQLGLGVAEVKQRIDELKAANKGMTDEMAYQQAILGLADEKFGDLTRSAEGAATQVEQLGAAWKNLRLEIGQELKPNVEEAASGLNDLLELINKVRAANAQRTQEALSRRAAEEGRIDPLGPAFSRTSIGRVVPTSIGGDGAGGTSTPAIDVDKLLDAQLDFARGMEDITRNSGRAIQDATEQFGRQRAETIRSYELGIARDAEDFAIARQRQQRDHERAILEVVRDAREREADWAADLSERTAEARQKSNERISEMEADYAKSRERAQAKHNDTLLDAAGRLDAQAVYEEQRNFARASKEAQEDRDERLEKERDNLQESLSQAQEAHDERLEEAREADARRLEDMRSALEQARADEDEDREIARERAAADHEQTLAQQAIDHQANLTRIANQAADERQALTDAFDQRMIDLGLHNVAVENERKRAEDAALKAIEPFTKKWFRTIAEAMEAAFPAAGHPSNADPYIDRTLPSILGSRPAPYNPVPNWMNNRASASASGTGPVTINIYPTPEQSEERIAQLVEETMIEIMERGAN